MKIVNITAYKFISLDDLVDLQASLKAECGLMEVKGTILLSKEGINIALSGTEAAIPAFTNFLSKDPRFSDIAFKYSYSTKLSFRRMLVKIKEEIIGIGIPDIAPEKFTGPHVSAKELKQWIDEGKDITILDARNTYEIEVGTFENAVDLRIDDFRSFPKACEKLDDALKEKPLVMFCTGGVRCEKASALMIEKGFKEVYQLDGGILKYFEECGGAHYNGGCFVFDDRLVVDSELQPLNS